MIVKEVNYFFNVSDKCICCGVLHKAINSINYCDDCARKRDSFANNIVGNVFIGEENSIQYKLLSPLENFRSEMINEQICRMIDNFFISHKNIKEFNELFNDNIIVVNAYKEKNVITEMVMNLVPFTYATCNNHHNKYLKYYAEYRDILEKMSSKDDEILKELAIKIKGYSYTKIS